MYKFDETSMSVVDSSNKSVFKVIDRYGGEQISALLFYQGIEMQIFANCSEDKSVVPSRTKWKVMKIYGEYKEDEISNINRLIEDCLKAYGAINGFGAGDGTVVVF